MPFRPLTSSTSTHTQQHSKMVSSSWLRGKLVGSGSFGTVNVAVDKQTGTVFAVKSVYRNSTVSPQIESLENEIGILKFLNPSPYVVTYLADDLSCENSCQTSSYRNLHIEYLPGGTVADMATAKAYVDNDENVLRSHVFCLVSALKHIHSNGVVHCDIKGRNVLISKNPNHCKLADFGSAKRVEDTCHKDRVLPRGSPLWMAPEVIRGESQGPESDIWSLGCTIVEMVTGKPLWEDSGAATLARIGFSDEVPNLPTQLSDLGRDFLKNCLRRDPTRRWSSDRLLTHPFINSVTESSTPEFSPRCVLDWVNSEFEEDEIEIESEVEKFEVLAADRIGKLAGKSGANWGSDGWIEVREYSTSATVEGTSSVYSNFTRVNLEKDSNFGDSWISPNRRVPSVKVDMGLSENYYNIFHALLSVVSSCYFTIFTHLLSILNFNFIYFMILYSIHKHIIYQTFIII